MKMNRIQRLLSSAVMILCLLIMGQNAIAQGKGHGGGGGQGQGQADKGPGGKGGPGEKAHGKANHHNGKQMLGDKIKTNGRHMLEKKGNYTSEVDVQNGKIAGVHVKHATKGEVPVKKYKTNQKMAHKGAQLVYASLHFVQDTYLGTTYIGYAYVDEYGDEEIYWFPYDMVLDGDTGAVEYVPAY